MTSSLPQASPDDSPFAAALQQHAERIRSSGLLGRSGQTQRLFDYLVECALVGRTPKEVEVAIDGFGRKADFDASQDALVRVYVHKLRRKLETYYAQPGAAVDGVLSIPRGEYRLVLQGATAAVPEPVVDAATAGELPPLEPPRGRARDLVGLGLILALAALCVGLLVDRWREPHVDATTRALRGNALWEPLLADDLPIQIVLGDYYIFGERDGADGVSRLIRDFDINSRADLAARIKREPALAAQYADMNLGYLPTSSAQALRSVLPVVTGAGKPVTISLASELSPSAFKTSHIVYIGYLSGLGMLQDVVFAGSHFAIGTTYDELVDMETGTTFSSEAGRPLPDTTRYRDYGYLSTFSGPEGNRHLVLAGTRDTAVMQTAEIAASPRRNDELLASRGKASAYEALYEVYGVARTNLEAKLLLTRTLDESAIWSEGTADEASVASAAGADTSR